MTPHSIRRAFVTVGTRQVHYRRAGSGPTVVLLPDSPRSSASLVPLMLALAPRFAVLALDTPGYGLSDPLELDEPSIEDYAGAVAATLASLAVERCGVYGRQTGAAIALELTRRHPAAVAYALLDGLPLYTEDEAAELLERYTPSFEPAIDGSHLASLWTSYRDRYLFSPWYRRERAARRDIAMPDAHELHAGVMDVLRAGNRYGAGDVAAFRYRAATALRELAVPTTVVARVDDVFAAHLDRLPELPPAVTVRRLEREEDVVPLFAEEPPSIPAAEEPGVRPLSGRIWRRYADTPHGQIFVRQAGEQRGQLPLVMLHASPGSAEMLVPLMTHLAQGREVIALDTLGNGDSDKPAWSTAEIADYAPVVAEATQALELECFDLYGSHTGALIALETALLVPERVQRLVLDGVTLSDAEQTADLLAHYTPPLEPSDDGTHLLFAWNFLRDQTLFWPWYNRTREGIRWVETIDPCALQVWLVELLKSGHTYPIGYRAAFSYRTGERIPLLETKTLLVAKRTDMLHETTHAAAALAPNAVAQTLPEDEEGAAAMITAFLNAS